MKLSIIILNYQSEGLVRYAIRAIHRQAPPVPYEIIVVNNDTAVDISFLQNEFPGIRTLNTGRNGGMGFGNNKGIAAAQGEYILIINPDTVVIDTAIEKLIRFLDQYSPAFIVAPRLLNPDQTLLYSCCRFPEHFFMPLFRRTILGKLAIGKQMNDRFLMKEYDHTSPRAVDWVQGSALLIRKSFLDAYGGFDERFFMYLEDTDLCMRVWQNGGEVWYYPDATMIHYFGHGSAEKSWIRSLFSFNKLAWVHIFSWTQYFWKWHFSSKNIHKKLKRNWDH